MDTGAAPPDTCEPGPFPLTQKRLDLIMLLDDAASLYTWWPSVRDGVSQFLLDANSSGVGVGLQLFDQSCAAQDYTTPLVAIAPLPDNAAALQRAIPAIASKTTSTVPALDGVLQHARSWASAHADAKLAVIAVTDATPGSCDATTGSYETALATLARDGLQGTPSIATYVVGFGALAAVPALARAGGTEPILIPVISSSQDVLAALRIIRSQAQPCAFARPSAGELSADSAITLTESDGSLRSYPIAQNRSSCDTQGGFYLEDATAPFPLIACPSLCTSISPRTQLTLSNTCQTP